MCSRTFRPLGFARLCRSRPRGSIHSLLPSSLYLDHSHCLVRAPATLAALPSTRAIETHSLPTSLAATHRGFAFYVAFSKAPFPRSRRVLCLARRSLGEGGSRVPRAPLKLARLPASLAPTLVALPSMSLIPSAPLPSLRNQKKLSCVWIFHDGAGRKTGDIDTLSLVRCIRTRDHAFPAWDRNSIGQTSFYFFNIRG